MRVVSPLSNLSDVLSQVKSSAARYAITLSKNEAATRAVLIDPILRALGWDTANTSMVEVEKTLLQTRADYALYDINGDVKVVVEAKQLGDNLNQQSVVLSLVNYAFRFGIQDIFLTDGLVWHHFTSFQPGNLAPTHKIDLTQVNAVDCAAYLVEHLDAAKFWPDEQSLDTLAQRVAQLESDLRSLQQSSRAAPGQPTMAPPPAPTTSSGGGPPHISQSGAQPQLVDLEALPNIAGTRPTLLRLPDGSQVPVSRWNEVLRECCKFALASNKQIPIPLPDTAGRKVNVLDTVRPPRGIAYVEAKYGGRDIYIYTNYDANRCVANAIHVLKQAPANAQSKAAVEFEQRG